MRISIVGPPLPIPPIGWGAVESLIWDMNISLKKMGHEVQILNDADPNKMLHQMNEFNPDFVHINYDDWVILYPYINRPCACTTHFAYLERYEMMGGYKERVFDVFASMRPVVFGLSDAINDTYHNLASIPSENLRAPKSTALGEMFKSSMNSKSERSLNPAATSSSVGEPGR